MWQFGCRGTLLITQGSDLNVNLIWCSTSAACVLGFLPCSLWNGLLRASPLPVSPGGTFLAVGFIPSTSPPPSQCPWWFTYPLLQRRGICTPCFFVTHCRAPPPASPAARSWAQPHCGSCARSISAAVVLCGRVAVEFCCCWSPYCLVPLLKISPSP